jgi:3-dehydroquinate synthase
VQFGIDNLKLFLAQHSSDLIVLADKHTLLDCYPLLEKEFPHFIVPYGEGYKNLNSCEYIWKKLSELNASRNTILLCLGGGVLCDMGAFAGSVYQRGMKIVLCPTSLLAMVDASVGGKNGVNFLGYKNYIGNFKEASETFICAEFLNTLPNKEWINGFVEMLKHGLIADKQHYKKVRLLFLATTKNIDKDLISDSIKIKMQHVDQDFKDEGIRKRLNFGHTIGHAIESWSLSISQENEELSHGYAVALGIIAESYISSKLAGLSDEELNEITTVLHPVVGSMNHKMPAYTDISEFLLKDKKNNGEGINFSLLQEIGVCKEDYIVSDEIITEAILYLNGVL